MKQHRRHVLGLLAGLPLAGQAFAQAPAPAPRVRIETAQGAIVLELYPDKAPVTVANFLRYVDEGRYKGGVFYRALRLDFAPERGLLQGGLNGFESKALPPIAHEPTSQTGISHKDGTISMARFAPGSAKCEFFICLGDSSYFDADPKQPGDNLGYAAFGQVVEGMDVVRALHQGPISATEGKAYGMEGQILATPVPMTAVKRG